MYRFLIITGDMRKWSEKLKLCCKGWHQRISRNEIIFNNDCITFTILPSILQSCGCRAEGAYIDYDTVEFNEEEKCVLLPCLRYGGFIAPIRELEYKLEDYGKI